MNSPKPKDLMDAAGISQSYASMILTGSRVPARSLAIHLYRKLGWLHSSISDLTEEQIGTLEAVDPYSRAA